MQPTSRRLPGWVHIPLIAFMGISLMQTALGFEELFGQAFAWRFPLRLRWSCTALPFLSDNAV